MRVTEIEAKERRHPTAVLCDIEPHSCVLELRTGQIICDHSYVLEGIGLGFLAGRVMWVRRSKAGLFFKHPVHVDALRRLKDLISTNPDVLGPIILKRVD